MFLEAISIIEVTKIIVHGVMRIWGHFPPFPFPGFPC